MIGIFNLGAMPVPPINSSSFHLAAALTKYSSITGKPMQLKFIKSAVLSWSVLGAMLQLSTAVQAQVVPQGVDLKFPSVENSLQKPNSQAQTLSTAGENLLQKPQGQTPTGNLEQSKVQAPLKLDNLRGKLQTAPRNPAELPPATCGDYNLH
jgi:hypothetical protein